MLTPFPSRVCVFFSDCVGDASANPDCTYAAAPHRRSTVTTDADATPTRRTTITRDTATQGSGFLLKSCDIICLIATFGVSQGQHAG